MVMVVTDSPPCFLVVLGPSMVFDYQQTLPFHVSLFYIHSIDPPSLPLVLLLLLQLKHS